MSTSGELDEPCPRGPGQIMTYDQVMEQTQTEDYTVEPLSLLVPLMTAPKAGEKPLSIDEIEQTAIAAGSNMQVYRPGAGLWPRLRNNQRARYDARFIQTFNPRVVRHLLKRLRAAEDTLAAHGIATPDPEEHEIALLHARRAAEQG